MVVVQAGNYGKQTISSKSDKTGTGDLADVVIQPASGARVTVAGLTLNGAAHLTIKSIVDGRSPQGAFQVIGGGDVLLKDLDAANFYIDRASNVMVDGGDWGPCTVPSSTCSNSKLDVGTGSNITIQNATFHDYRIVPNSGEHFECMIVFGGQNITIRGNTFRNCEFYNIFIQHPIWAGGSFDGRSPEGMLIENNSFTPVWENGVWGVRFSALAFSPRRIPFKNITVRCNSLSGGAYIEPNDDSDGTVYQNFSISGC